MKLKLDDNGNAVVQDGMPVYVHDDGNEVPLDAQALVQRVNNLTEEKDRHFTNFKDMSEKFKAFEGMDAEAAKKALATVKNIDDKKLVDAGEVDKLKVQIAETFEADKKTMQRQMSEMKENHETELKSKDNTIFNLMVSSQFAKSSFFSGENPKTILPPDMASEYFGKHFEIVGEGASAKVIGKLNGEVIPSRKKYGEPAEFEEAIGVILDHYPMKDRILRSSGGGSGSGGNTGGGLGEKTIARGDLKAFGDNLEAIAKGEVSVK